MTFDNFDLFVFFRYLSFKLVGRFVICFLEYFADRALQKLRYNNELASFTEAKGWRIGPYQRLAHAAELEDSTGGILYITEADSCCLPPLTVKGHTHKIIKRKNGKQR
jgi:hypothetical protein